MGFKTYHISLVALITFMVISSAAMGWALSTTRVHLAIMLALGILVEAVLIFTRLTRVNREILYFFRALENDDTSLRYSSNHRNSIINELHRHLKRVNENFQNIQVNNELREQYFGKVLEHLSSGLIIISGTGHINKINEEALRLLNLHQLTHIKALSQSYPGLSDRIEEMKSLDRSELILVDRETGIKKVMGLQAVKIKLKGEEVKLLTLQDLSAEMERKEIDDWIRLIRVMSHEIMNSLAPITSISTTLKEVWSEQGSTGTRQGISEAKVKQTLKGLDAIAEQSEGLTTFFESYRILSRIPDPVRKEFTVCSLFDKLETLVDHYRENPGLLLEFKCKDPDLKIRADEQMLVQVLLNLLKNAVEAVEGIEAAEIVISAYAKSDRIILQVADNGAGIAPELSGEIFMPFFTTRKKGTGVGLSYSRQVMAMHAGRIEFDSQPGKTRFRLVF
ncbi:MAG: hypothetical protein AMK71_10765 [Nitrospira bacterium SG8_35_4]|nr:MAG: hypothetical protein AMK71_10765 [Nitrospira bacterium SG8_35_4]